MIISNMNGILHMALQDQQQHSKLFIAASYIHLIPFHSQTIFDFSVQ